MAFDEFKKLMDQFVRPGIQAGQIRWPDDDESRVQLCRAILGSQIAVRMDRILDTVEDWMTNRESQEFVRPESDLARKDREHRTLLQSVPAAHREALRFVARYAAISSLHGAMVSLDQFFGCHCRILCKPLSEQVQTGEIQVAPTSMDLHDDLVEWILEFSRYADVLAYREIRGPNSSVIGFK